MKTSNLAKTGLLAVIVLAGIYLVSCQTEVNETQNTNSGTKASVQDAGPKGSVEEAYKGLFAAVKSKKTSEIEKVMSKATLGFAKGIAGQRKVGV